MSTAVGAASPRLDCFGQQSQLGDECLQCLIAAVPWVYVDGDQRRRSHGDADVRGGCGCPPPDDRRCVRGRVTQAVRRQRQFLARATGQDMESSRR